MLQTKNNYHVSEQTSAFIECLKLESELFDAVFNATYAIYGEDTRAFDRFANAYDTMKDELNRLLCASIHDVLLIDNNGEI